MLRLVVTYLPKRQRVQLWKMRLEAASRRYDSMWVFSLLSSLVTLRDALRYSQRNKVTEIALVSETTSDHFHWCCCLEWDGSDGWVLRMWFASCQDQSSPTWCLPCQVPLAGELLTWSISLVYDNVSSGVPKLGPPTVFWSKHLANSSSSAAWTTIRTSYFNWPATSKVGLRTALGQF